MAKSILTLEQRLFLDFFRQNQDLTNTFYFTGGTCLAEYYLHHRFSEDLDFFSEQEIEPQMVTILLKKSQTKLGFETLDFQQSFNRNLYFLTFSNGSQLKVKFTYFPFPRIVLAQTNAGLPIDSLQDIAVNKLFTIYQKPRGRDFYDLYAIHQQERWQLTQLMQQARNKFDTHIDPLQLGRNLMQVHLLKDDPLVSDQTYPYSIVTDFFNEVALSLSSEVVE